MSAQDAVYEYAEAEDDSTTFSVALHASPWRLYGPDWRILSLDDLAKRFRKGLKPVHKAVVLFGSWTAVPPGPRDSSIAARLSARMGGFPVVGQDGFVWFSRTGSVRTTRQAFTMYPGNYTRIRKGEDVFVSATTAWAIPLEDRFVKTRDGGGLLRAGVAWDVFNLCPEKVLDRFEAAADLSDPIAGYNAAVMRLEECTSKDTARAIELLKRSAKLGDEPSSALLSRVVPSTLSATP